MKKLVVVGLFLNAAVLLTLWFEVSADAGSPRLPSGNGDVNGDGDIDISDATYLLSWLFLGGTAPVPMTAADAPGLLGTGQTACYDAIGNEIDCASDDTCPGQDGRYATGCSAEDRFVDNGDGTVTDRCTGLMWQKETGNDGAALNWCSALDYCENLDFAGYDDWRLPNVRELQSIVDYGRREPAIDPVFGASSSQFYWSSTTSVPLEAHPAFRAWNVEFRDGQVIIARGLKSDDFLVRAVRNERGSP